MRSIKPHCVARDGFSGSGLDSGVGDVLEDGLGDRPNDVNRPIILDGGVIDLCVDNIT